jgi:hypothetical protein
MTENRRSSIGFGQTSSSVGEVRELAAGEQQRDLREEIARLEERLESREERTDERPLTDSRILLSTNRPDKTERFSSVAEGPNRRHSHPVSGVEHPV